MDQLILAWLGNKESGRHNVAVETETNRHNLATERETRRHNVSLVSSNNFNALMNRYATERAASISAAATRYASDNSRRAQEYAASTNAAASRYRTATDAWTSLVRDATSRQANAIQDRYNQGRLAIAASEFHEMQRSNLAREQENRLSRYTNAFMKEKELEYKQAVHEFEQSKYRTDLSRRAAEFEANLRMRSAETIVDLLGVGAKARMFKGGNNYGTSTQTTRQILQGKGSTEETPQEFWKRLSDGFDRELSR